MGWMRVISASSGGSPAAPGAGMWTTLQDRGRPGLSMMGVPAGGAADSISLRVGNALAGNAESAAALEMTLTGASVEFESPATVALAGAFGEARLVQRGGGEQAAPCWSPFRVEPGDRVHCGPLQRGARGYLCVSGGVTAPDVLGSAATYLAGGIGFGGLGGRTLREGDRVEFGHASFHAAGRGSLSDAELRWIESCVLNGVLRAVPGSHAELFSPASEAAFWGASFVVQARSDRLGVRLAPNGASIQPPAGGRLPSEGMPHGAVQVPSAGEAILLGPDHPTTGGYPVIAAVIAADLPAIGQLRPGSPVRFERVSVHEARRLWRAQNDRLKRIIG